MINFSNSVIESILKRGCLIWTFSILFYFASLYPARFGKDTNGILNDLAIGDSTSQWTALYFRFLQLISINGHLVALASLVSLILYAFSLEIFLQGYSRSKKSRDWTRFFFATSPFYGVFGMTIDHQLFSLCGLLNMISLLRIKTAGNENLPFLSRHFVSPTLFFISALFAQMTFQGLFLSIILIYMYLGLRGLFVVALLVSFSFISPNLLNVRSEMLSDMRLIPLLGDIKCVVQHPKVELSATQLRTLEDLGPINSWKSLSTCAVADNAFFALNGSSIITTEVIKLWVELVKEYPQLVLTAHTQRSSMALPPPFFRSQPNHMPTDDLLPAGKETSVELHQWSELFKTSVDNQELKEGRPFIVRVLEPLPLLYAFIFNQNSMFWGWGGMWLIIFFILSCLREVNHRKADFQISFILLSLSVVLFLISPISSPRYVFLQVVIGVIGALDFIINRYYCLVQKQIK